MATPAVFIHDGAFGTHATKRRTYLALQGEAQVFGCFLSAFDRHAGRCARVRSSGRVAPSFLPALFYAKCPVFESA